MADDINGTVEEGALLQAVEVMQASPRAHSLIVSDGISECVVYFAIGGIRIIRSGPRTGVSVGELLIEQGLLPRDDYVQLLAAVDGDDTKALTVALEQGVVTRDEYLSALREKFDEDLLDLFVWEGAEVRLVEGQPPEEFYARGHQSESLTVDVPTFLRALLMKLEMLSGGARKINTGREIYEVSDRALLASVDLGVARPLFDHFDGKRTLAACIDTAGLRRIPCHRMVQQLMQQGSLRRIAGSAAQKASREHYLREAAALEDALKVSLAQHIVMARLARALENAGESTRAAAHWRQLGDHFRRINDLDRALPHYRRAARLLPADFATRELILEIHRHKRNYKLLIGEGKPLAELFLRHNLLGRAKSLLLQLIGFDEADIGLRRLLITVLIGLGETDLALEQLWILAGILEERGASAQQLRDVYLRILALDKRNKKARKRLDEVTGVAGQRRTVVAIVGGTLALLVTLFGGFGYEMYARGEMRQALAEARRMLELRDYEGARELLHQASARFRWFGGGSNAQRMLTWIDEVEAEMIRRQQEAEGLGALGLSPEVVQAATEMSYRAATLLEEGRLEESHRVYAELFELYPWSEALDTAEMPLRVTVLPTDAKVYLNGTELGQGEVTFRYVPRAKSSLTVERDGFEVYRKVLDGPQPFHMDVWLSKPVLWSFQSDAPFESAPLIVGETLYLAGRDRFLTALSTRDGQPRWRAPLGYYCDCAAAPVETEGGVVVATALGDVLAVTALTGETLWRRALGVNVERQPVATGGDVIVPGEDGSLMALALADGESRWNTSPGTVRSGAPTLLPSGEICFVDQTGGLGLADPTTGALRASESGPAGLRETPVCDGERVWTWSSDGSLRLFSARSTSPLKRFATPRCDGFLPVLYGSAAYVVTPDGRLTAYKLEGGMVFDPVSLPEPAAASPAVADGCVYVPGAKGGLTVLDAETGRLIWRFAAGAPLTAPPLVRGDRVYLTTRTGRVVALER